MINQDRSWVVGGQEESKNNYRHDKNPEKSMAAQGLLCVAFYMHRSTHCDISRVECCSN